MGSKLINCLIWTLLCVLVLGILWCIIQPIVWWTPYSEVRLYIRIFLLMFAVNTFAVLRLYNSIVQNTRFSIKLRETLIKFMGAFPSLERAMKTMTNAMNASKTSMDSLKKETSDNTDSVKKFTDSVNKKFKN